MARIAFKGVVVGVLLIALAGCAGQRSHALLLTAEHPAAESEIAARHSIFVATTRRKAEKIPAEVFDGRRSPDTLYARVGLTVPTVHKTGKVERPKGNAGDPAKYITATDVSGYADERAFQKALGADIAARGGRALVFVHGYNNHFDDAVYRATQITHDSGYGGTPVLFSWASAGRTVDYVYDTNSASAARDNLEDLLRLLMKSGAKRIDVVAHSMGNWVTMEALRQLAMTGDRDLDGRLGDVVLASPDIDIDVFKSQMRRYGKPKRPFFVLVSRDDRALRLSGLIAGERPRLGDYTNEKDVAEYGIVVVDMTGVKSDDSMNHAKFADNPLLVKMLGDRLNDADGLGSNNTNITDRINGLARGLGSTVVSAAEIVITTPAEVLNVAVGN